MESIVIYLLSGYVFVLLGVYAYVKRLISTNKSLIRDNQVRLFELEVLLKSSLQSKSRLKNHDLIDMSEIIK